MKSIFLGVTPTELEHQTASLLAKLLGEFSPSQNLNLYEEAFGVSVPNPRSFRTMNPVRLAEDLPRSAMFCKNNMMRPRDIQRWGFHLSKMLPIDAPLDGLVSRAEMFDSIKYRPEQELSLPMRNTLE